MSDKHNNPVKDNKPIIKILETEEEDQGTLICNSLKTIFNCVEDCPHGVIRTQTNIAIFDYGAIITHYYYLHMSRTKSKIWKYVRRLIVRLLPQYNLVLKITRRDDKDIIYVELSNIDILNIVQTELKKLTFLHNITIKIV